VGGDEARALARAEPAVKYHPCSVGFLTPRRNPAGGQWQAGSLTGAVASQMVTEALEGRLSTDGTVRRA
jgi:hypothetical protein